MGKIKLKPEYVPVKIEKHGNLYKSISHEERFQKSVELLKEKSRGYYLRIWERGIGSYSSENFLGNLKKAKAESIAESKLRELIKSSV